jgi:nitrogen-specific signal transduction histidine kinase
MQEQLLISDRMASVGILSASLAHDINTPLTVISANLEFVAQHLAALASETSGAFAGEAGDQPAAQLAAKLGQTAGPLRDAVEAAERVRHIVRDLKVFSRSAEEERREPVDIQRVLESAVRMASNEIRHRANLVRDYADVPPVEGQEARLGQVFLNLIVNAAQAIPEGRVAVNEIRLTTRLDDAGRIVVEVRDTGVGISSDVLSRIFDPFFTTKTESTGTGLGLAICHRIVRGLGGDIAVESQPGRGTIFRVFLLRAQNELKQETAAQPETISKRKGRVLVVDDEPMLCATIERILANDHDVMAMTSARQAAQLIARGDRFDIILSDLMMPEMTGMDFYRELRRSAPDQADKIVFMTGGAFSQDAAAFLHRMPNPSIEKPFKSKALRELLQGLMR